MDNKILTNRQLHITTVKRVNQDIKKELEKIMAISYNLTATDKIPLEWRKKQSGEFASFIMENRHLTLEELNKKLEEL